MFGAALDRKQSEKQAAYELRPHIVRSQPLAFSNGAAALDRLDLGRISPAQLQLELFGRAFELVLDRERCSYRGPHALARHLDAHWLFAFDGVGHSSEGGDEPRSASDRFDVSVGHARKLPELLIPG